MEKVENSKNEMYIINKDVSILIIYNNTTNVCIIDTNMVDYIASNSWHIKRSGYVTNSKKELLHKKVINSSETGDIDHINNNKLDNRIENLRVVSRSQNNMNRAKVTSQWGVKGITRDKRRITGWIAHLKYDNNRLFKSFKRFDDAVKLRLIWEADIFKTYSYCFNRETNSLQLTYFSYDDERQTYIEVSLDGQILQFKKL